MIEGLPFGLLVRIAGRNLLAHKVKTLIVASILTFGTALVVVGFSLVDSVNGAMATSIQSSLVGQVQLQSETGKDPLAIFGQAMMGDDVGVIEDFSKVKAGLAEIPDIRAIVPMGINGSITYGGNYVDRMLEKLRAAVKSGDTDKATVLRDHVRGTVKILTRELSGLKDIAADSVFKGEEVQDLARANSEEFWAGFDADPLAALEFLENKIAPLALEEAMIFVHYVGTDLDTFAKSFDRFHIVEGQMVPPGRRGFLFSKHVYDEQIKNKTARRLDLIREGREQGKTIATDPDMQEDVRQNVAQYRDIVIQVDPTESDALRRDLTAALPPGSVAADADLVAVLQAFMAMDDETFDARYKVFYDAVAPRIQLYSVPVGSVLTLQAFTRSGYVKSVNVPVYGVFEFRGIDKSALAGGHNLMDLMTFRDLFGYRTEADQAEIAAIKEGAGVADIDRADAEAELFGGGDAPIVEEKKAQGFDEFAGVELGARQRYDQALFDRVYSQQEIEGGVVLNAAVLLKDVERLPEAIREITRVSAEKGLGLRALDWKTASGIAGQFITMISVVLFVVILIIFTVAIVIINNALVMATMERVREIGTLRAMGAQRSLVCWMLFVESALVAGVFGLLGAALGSAIVLASGAKGIPATTDVLHFLFGGPRLYPFLTSGHLIGALVIVLLVSVVSTLYPAWVATRVTPLAAMQKED